MHHVATLRVTGTCHRYAAARPICLALGLSMNRPTLLPASLTALYERFTFKEPQHEN